MGRKPKTSTLPPNWPTDSPITYLTSPAYSKHLTSTQLQTIHTPPGPQAPIESSAHIPPVHIVPITDPTHPAHPQRGLFAARDLPPNTFILFYLGHVHSDADADADADNDPTSDYDLSMDRDARLAVDAAAMGNEARFVNDYRGVPGREGRGPNCEFRDCWTRGAAAAAAGGGGGGRGRRGRWERRVGVYVLPVGNAGKRRDGVKRGEEILVSYGKGFWCKGAGKEVKEEEEKEEEVAG